MPPFDPSEQLVSVRLRALVRRDGLQGVADFYGVQRQTVRRWVRGSNPNSEARRSIVRRALPLTGAVVQNPSGGFSPERTLYRPEAIAFQRIESQRRRDRATEQLRGAATEQEFEMAMALQDDEVSFDEAVDFDTRLARLQFLSDSGMDWSDWEEYWGPEDDWDAFRSAYEQMAG